MSKRNNRNDSRGLSKKSGQVAATEWLMTARIQEQVNLAGYDFRFGDTLNDLIEEGLELPASKDQVFSWGFYKQVKSFVHHCVFIYKKAQAVHPHTD